MSTGTDRCADKSATAIAVVEDDPEIRDLVVAFLEREGYRVTGFADGGAFDACPDPAWFDLIVLDIMMPGEDGLSICRRLVTPDGPGVIILSAKGDDLDRIIGLEIGADDYLAKPFNPRELLARVKSVLRRKRPSAPQASSAGPSRTVLTFAGWRLDADQHALTSPKGESVSLSSGEFALLLAFARHPRRVVSREQLLDWTRGESAAPVDRAIDVQLSRLRRKLRDDPKNPSLIKTVRGDGYLFAVQVGRSEGS